MTHSMDFSGKRVVVTGAASGIGRATAALIRDLGGSVLALDLLPVDLDAMPIDPEHRREIRRLQRAIVTMRGRQS